jgi:hypothetical protein
VPYWLTASADGGPGQAAPQRHCGRPTAECRTTVCSLQEQQSRPAGRASSGAPAARAGMPSAEQPSRASRRRRRRGAGEQLSSQRSATVRVRDGTRLRAAALLCGRAGAAQLAKP